MSVNKVIVTNAASLASAVTNSETNDTTCISIEATTDDVLQLSATLNIPKNFTGNASKTLVIEGNGITLQPASNLGTNVALIKRNNGIALDNTACSVVIRNINFDCRNYPMYALELASMSNIVIENCKFDNCKVGLSMINVNRAAINNCTAYNVKSAGFMDGVDNLNLNTNCTDITYTNCKVTSIDTNPSNIIGFSSYATGGLSYYQCATLGRVGYSIFFDSAGGTGSPNSPNDINNVQIRNFKAPTADNAIIRLKLSDGFAKIDGLYITSNTVPGFIIDADAYVMPSGIPNPHLYVENVPYLPNTGKFNTLGGIPSPVNCPVAPPDNVLVWEFKEIYDGRNIFSPARWNNSLIPYYRFASFFDESKIILADSIFVNTKYI